MDEGYQIPDSLVAIGQEMRVSSPCFAIAPLIVSACLSVATKVRESTIGA
jgi:hypothetical protein